MEEENKPKRVLRTPIGPESITDERLLHYNLPEEMFEDFKRYEAVDWGIAEVARVKEMTGNLAGFGTDRSQRVIIDYDKDYGYFVVRRIPMEYGKQR